MRSLADDLGEMCYDDLSRMLNELVDRVINGAASATDPADFAQYRSSLNEEYIDSIYRVILRARKEKRA